jgi:hypothetical protein
MSKAKIPAGGDGDSDALKSLQTVGNIEYIQVTTDNDDKVLEGITTKGVKKVFLPIDTPSAIIEHDDSPEWINVVIDKTGKVLEGFTSDGKKKVMTDVEVKEIYSKNVKCFLLFYSHLRK